MLLDLPPMDVDRVSSRPPGCASRVFYQRCPMSKATGQANFTASARRGESQSPVYPSGSDRRRRRVRSDYSHPEWDTHRRARMSRGSELLPLLLYHALHCLETRGTHYSPVHCYRPRALPQSLANQILKHSHHPAELRSNMFTRACSSNLLAQRNQACRNQSPRTRYYTALFSDDDTQLRTRMTGLPGMQRLILTNKGCALAMSIEGI